MPGVDFISPFRLYTNLLRSVPNFYALKASQKLGEECKMPLRPTFSLNEIHPLGLMNRNLPVSQCIQFLQQKLSFHVPMQGNLYAGGRLLYRLCSRQPTVELAVRVLKILFYN